MDMEKRTAIAQLWLSVTFITGYFVVLGIFLTGRARVPVEWKDVFTTLISLLTAGVLMILQFWFSRSRSGTTPATPPPTGD